MREIEAILVRIFGIDPAAIGPAAMEEAIRSAYRESGCRTPQAFVSAVRHDGAQQRALVARVAVPETWFFRDGTPFEFLRRHATRWAEHHPEGTLRVLSAPCASGEEPYSIAMTLVDAGFLPGRFVVDAVDVSEPLLDRARRGLYQESALRNCPETMRRRYFSARERGFLLDEAVRAGVTFERRNLIEPGITLPSPPYDVVFCRNLLIYLHQAARRDLVRLLDGCLAADGVLVVGCAEALPLCEDATFALADSRAFALARAPERAHAAAGEPER